MFHRITVICTINDNVIIQDNFILQDRQHVIMQEKSPHNYMLFMFFCKVN